jgi:hypothetical protein
MEECFHGLGLDEPPHHFGGGGVGNGSVKAPDPQLELRRIYVQLRNQLEAKREYIARRVEVEVHELVAGKGIATAAKGDTILNGKENTGIPLPQSRTVVTLPTPTSNGIARAPPQSQRVAPAVQEAAATSNLLSSSTHALAQQRGPSANSTDPLKRVISPRKILVTVSQQQSNAKSGSDKITSSSSYAAGQQLQFSRTDEEEEDEELYCV